MGDRSTSVPAAILPRHAAFYWGGGVGAAVFAACLVSSKYALAIGAQVADVAVTSGAMRRLVPIHGVFSFFFNTVIVAATVNVVVTIAGG